MSQYETWLIWMNDVPEWVMVLSLSRICYDNTWHDSFICVVTHSHMRFAAVAEGKSAVFHVWHDLFICNMTHSYVTWRLHMCHDPLIYVSWLTRICDLLQWLHEDQLSSTCAMTHSHVRRSITSAMTDSFVRLAVDIWMPIYIVPWKTADCKDNWLAFSWR